jgi:hypothetical protein
LGFTAPVAVMTGGDLLAGVRDTTATVVSSDAVGNRSVIVAETADGETVDMKSRGGWLRDQMPRGSTVRVWVGEFSGRTLNAVTPSGARWGAGLLATPVVLACAVLAALAAGVLLLFHRRHLLMVAIPAPITAAGMTMMFLIN